MWKSLCHTWNILKQLVKRKRHCHSVTVSGFLWDLLACSFNAESNGSDHTSQMDLLFTKLTINAPVNKDNIALRIDWANYATMTFAAGNSTKALFSSSLMHCAINQSTRDLRVEESTTGKKRELVGQFCSFNT